MIEGLRVGRVKGFSLPSGSAHLTSLLGILQKSRFCVEGLGQAPHRESGVRLMLSF